MCAHVRGKKPTLPPEYPAAILGEVNTLFGFALSFPGLLIPTCLL